MVRKEIELTIIAMIILVPMVFNTRCYTVFAPSKEFTYEVLVIIGLMSWMFKMLNEGKIKFASTPLNLPVISFIAICTLSLIWSDTFFTSLKELPLFLSGPLLYFVIVNNIRDEKQIKYIISTIIIMGTVLGIYGIFQYNDIDFAFWKVIGGRNKVFGLCGNVGYFAGYLILPLSFAIPLFFTSKNMVIRSLLYIGIAIMGSTFIVTFSRSAYLALGTALIFMLFLLGKDNKKIFIIILIAIIVVILLFAVPNFLGKKRSIISEIKARISITKIINTLSFGRRATINKFTWMMIKDRLILGSGIGTYKYNTLKYQADFFEQGDNRSIYHYGFADKAHNEYLQLWAELGIIGLAIFIWLMITYFNYGIRYLKREKDERKQGMMIGLMGGVVAFLVDCVFWFPMHLAANVSLFWIFIGVSMVLIKIKKEKGDE